MKAKLIKVDGTMREVAPANGRYFELRELCGLIECEYIEVIRPVSHKDAVLVIDERGKLEGKPFNELATAAWQNDPIAGNALLCQWHQLLVILKDPPQRNQQAAQIDAEGNESLCGAFIRGNYLAMVFTKWELCQNMRPLAEHAARNAPLGCRIVLRTYTDKTDLETL